MAIAGHCRNCGHEVTAGARFCAQCGEALGDLRPRAGTGLLPSNHKLNGERFLIVRKLAQGGQSAVYLAMDTASGGRVAIKEMGESQVNPTDRDKAVNDFLREATILGALSHPYLCRVYSTFVEDGKHFLVMEYILGHNLEDELIGLGRPLEWQRVAVWGIQLADVLGYLHAQLPPIVYRDLKPANVMLTPKGAIKLIDFGIARQLYAQRPRDTARLGTDGYAPLEQYSGRSEPRSDLYALGASLYHLLTGRIPEAAPARYQGQPLTPPRALNSSIPDTLERVILQALNMDVHNRFPSAMVMRQALEWASQLDLMANGSARNSYDTAASTAGTAGQSSLGSARGPGGRSTGRASAPRLRVWPLRLDAGLLEANQFSIQTLELGNRGGGQLMGITETNSACVTVEPARLDPSTPQLQVRVNTIGLPPGEYICHIAVRTNGGDQIVPVRFMVRPQGNVPASGWRSSYP